MPVIPGSPSRSSAQRGAGQHLQDRPDEAVYLIRSDLTGYQHLHPTMASDGTWTITATSPPAAGGCNTDSIPVDSTGGTHPVVLSVPLHVTGTPGAAAPLPDATRTATVDGHTVRLTGTAQADQANELTFTVSKNGAPVTDIQPYLDSYAHMTALQSGSLAYEHLHPCRPPARATPAARR